MKTTAYALQVKIDLLLGAQTPIVLPDGKEAWDYEPDYRLVWIDRAHASHLCDVPPSPMPRDYRPHTLCGQAVETARLRLVEDGEFGDPSCSDCFRANLARANTTIFRADPKPRLRALVERVRQSSMLWGALLCATVIGLSAYDGELSHRTTQMASPAVVHPVATESNLPKLDDTEL